MTNKKRKFRKIIGITVFLILIILSLIASFYFFKLNENADFEVDRLFIRTVLKEKGSANINLKITNNLDPAEFTVEIRGIEDLVSIKEDKFSLGIDEEKNLNLAIDCDCNDTIETPPGIYLGNIQINSGKIIKKIPIIVEVQSEDVLFSSNVLLIPQGSDLIPGQKLNSEIKIFNLEGFSQTSLQLIYFIKSFDGRTIISESEEVFVDGSSISLSKSFSLPSNLRLGDYSFGVITKYGEDSIGTSSRLFEVVENIEPGRVKFESRNFIIVVSVFGIFFIIFLVLFIYFIFYRDKLLNELQKQYKKELRNQRELISETRKENYPKLKTSDEKREYEKELMKIGKQRLKQLKNIQKERVGEFRIIKRKYKGRSLKKQLDEWKRKGYDTSVLEKKYKFPDAGSVRKKIAEWKKKGYDTSVLEKK
jgi:hypothetical protein